MGALKGKEIMKRKLLLLTAALALAACGGGSEPTTGTISVTGQDYAFRGVPELVATGAELTFTNSSAAEFHEMVVLRVLGGETLTVDELLALPEEEVESLTEFRGVLVAMPGEDAINPEGGDPWVTLTEPGRYILICAIPQGADPEAVTAAMQAAGGEPPALEGGAPHFTIGMRTGFTVEGDA
jgi:hypothetical protein